MMHNFDITSIIRYLLVPNGDIRKNNLTYMDIDYEKIYEKAYSSDSTTYPSAMGIKLYLKELNKENVKLFTTDRMDELFVEILDKYYELYKRDWDDVRPEFRYDVKEDFEELRKTMIHADRLIGFTTRYGMSNVVIVPNERYVDAFHYSDKKVIVNKTNYHTDKIFLIRINSDNSSPGLTLFVDNDIIGGRYIKLTKIISKIKKKRYDMPFNYCISEVGMGVGKYVKIIKLIE
jgi:hypothetical protein